MDAAEIEKLANLARLKLSREEIETLASDINSILSYVSEIQSVATVDAAAQEPDAHRNITRADNEPHESGLYTDALMQNAPNTERGFVKVKKIIDHE